MPEDEFLFRIRADTSDAEAKVKSTYSKARDAELAMYRVTHLIEFGDDIAKQFFGVSLPKGVREGINEIQKVIATVRTLQILIYSDPLLMALLGAALAAGGLAAFVYGFTSAAAQGAWSTQSFQQAYARGGGPRGVGMQKGITYNQEVG